MNTQLFLEGMEVDLTDVINIPLTKSFEDLSNPTNINNEFSKTIKIPVSEKNNEILGKAFRLDRMVIAYDSSTNEGKVKNIGKYLNPTRKIPFTLMCNGDLIMKGYAKLSLIDNSYDSKYYTINLFGVLGDLFHKLLNVAVITKFCPELTVDEIWEDQSQLQLHTYAIPLDPITDEVIDVSKIDIKHVDNYKWRDERYLMDDCLSGRRTVCAKDLKECWETDPDVNVSRSQLGHIKGNGLDWSIVGLMPTHHGFPDDFDPKSYEHHNATNGYNENIQFVNTANEICSRDIEDGGQGLDLDHSSLIDAGLTEEQFQQFVSWQQKPYIYINKLFMLFQKHMKDNPELFDGYELEIDPVWAKESTDDDPSYVNPYWSNLCYTFDFLFNQDIDAVESQYDIIWEPDVYYKHISAADDDQKTETVGLRNYFSVRYSGDKVINNITLDGYVCVALPCYQHFTSGSWCATTDGSIYDGKFKFSTTQKANAPELFFTHYVKYKQYDAGAKEFSNGGYMLTIKVLDENNNVINTIKNSWSPLHVSEYGKLNYKNKQTRKLIDPNIVNGKIIDIVKETDEDKAAVLLHRTFDASQVNNGLLKEYSGEEKPEYKNWFIGIGLPLRSFGDIPVGVKNPRFELTVEMMSERWNAGDSAGELRIKDEWQYSIGAYIGFDLNGNYVMKPCKLDSMIFPYRSDWELQTTNSNYSTLFYQHTDTSLAICKYDRYSSNAQLNAWLNGDGASGVNEYGRYNALVLNQLKRAYGADAVLYYTMIDGKIKIGKDTEFNSTGLFVDNHHKSPIKLKNLWVKEDGLFNILIEYSKIYGLFWTVDNYRKKIRLLTRLTYFDNYTIENWDDKIDKSKDFQITPILHASKYLNFDYDDEKDAMHYTMYGENYLVNYGGYRLKTGYEFTPEDEDLYKGVQSSCFSNRPILTWSQITNYNPIKVPYVVSSPFTMLDCDSKDGKKPIEIENWVFRNPSTTLFTTEEKKSGKYYTDSEFVIIDDTPTMTATQKYMYLDCDRKGTDYYGSGSDGNGGLGLVQACTTFPNFNNVSKQWGCLFAAPAQDYTIPETTGDGDSIGRYNSTPLILAKDNGKWIYKYAWKRWMDERYNVNNKKLTCYVNLKPSEFVNITPFNPHSEEGGILSVPSDLYFSNFKIIDGQLFMLNKIYDFNPLSNETTKCDFIQITDVDAYRDETLAEFGEFKLSSNINVGSDGVYHTGTKYISDYNSTDAYKSGKPSPVSIKVRNTPPSDARFYSTDSDTSFVIVSDGTRDYTQLLPSNSFNNGNNFTYVCTAKFEPYFTWFVADDCGDERTVKFRGENSSGLADSIIFGVKNKQAKLYSNSGWGETMQQVYTPNITIDSFDIYSTTGLRLVRDYVSFYEIPLLCTNNATDGTYGGQGTNVVINVILPTSNRCVDTEYVSDNYSSHIPFDSYEHWKTTGKEMLDTVGSDELQLIMYNIKHYGKAYPSNNEVPTNPYSDVSLLPTYQDQFIEDWDKKEARVKLFTTVIFHLAGCNDIKFAGENSEAYAYEYYDFNGNKPMLYAGKQLDQIHRDFSLADMFYYAGLNPIQLGCGESSKVRSLDGTWKSVLNTNFTIHYQGQPVSSNSFYNNPDTSSSITTPQLGKSRILDYYNNNNYYVPFLTDYDVLGEDGYIYKTYYQDVNIYARERSESFLVLEGVNNIPTGAVEKYIAYPCKENVFVITPELRVYYNGKLQKYYDDFDVEVEVRYGQQQGGYSSVPTETAVNTPYYDKNNKTIVIPQNDTGYERWITFKFKWNNTLIWEEITIYQAGCSSD